MFNLSPTPFDVRLMAFGIPIRVHPTFWLAMVVLGWNPDHPQYTFIWVVCGFVSILIHELGHAVTAEWFGWPTEIVMYFGGGLASSRRDRNNSEGRNIVVAFMGPVAGFLFYAQLCLIIYFLVHYRIRVGEYGGGALNVLLFMNLWWGLFNLLPVLPLDGGHIFQSLAAILGFRNPRDVSLKVGAVVGGAAAYYFFVKADQQYPGMLMLMLCLQNVSALQSPR